YWVGVGQLGQRVGRPSSTSAAHSDDCLATTSIESFVSQSASVAWGGDREVRRRRGSRERYLKSLVGCWIGARRIAVALMETEREGRRRGSRERYLKSLVGC